MANFDDIKKTAAETAGAVADKSIVFARMVADKTKCVARIAVLRADISSEKELLRRDFKELGKAYYEAHKDDPEPALEQLCTDVSVTTERIAAKRREIEELKEQLRSDNETQSDAQVDAPDDDEPECGCAAAEPAEEEPAAETPCCCCGGEEAPEAPTVQEVTEAQCGCGCCAPAAQAEEKSADETPAE